MSRWKEALGFTKNHDTQNPKINHQNDLYQSKDLMHNVIDDDIVLLQTAASTNPDPQFCAAGDSIPTILSSPFQSRLHVMMLQASQKETANTTKPFPLGLLYP